jgi:hypothetical protein
LLRKSPQRRGGVFRLREKFANVRLFGRNLENLFYMRSLGTLSRRFLGRRGIISPAIAVPLLLGTFLPSEGDEPVPVSEGDFAALTTNSPFLRSLDLSQSLILTGIARIEEDLYATLFDRESRETHVVSKSANGQGWRMVEVTGKTSDLETVTARIAVAGGEVFTVRFDENQLKPGEGKPGGGPGGGPGQASSNSPAANYKEGIRGDGFRGPPPPEIVEKMSKMSEEQREKMILRIQEIREKNPEISSEERRTIFNRMLDRELEGQR